MRTKILPIVLPPTLYKQLERDGRAAERDVLQQARWVLRRALETPQNDPAREPDPTPAA